jgi:hypothetical protein
MQRKRRAGRVAAEAYVEPDVLSARTVKVATRDLTSYEQAYYTSESKHDKGTNDYTFEFAGSWRTKTGRLEFGVRGLYLKKVHRTLAFQLTAYQKADDGWEPITVDGYPLAIPFYYVFREIDNVGTMMAALNEQCLKGLEQFMEGHEFEPWWGDFYNRYEWREETDGTIDFIPTLDPKEYTNTYKWALSVGTNSDMVTTFKMTLADPITIDNVTFGKPVLKMWDRQNILVRANFVEQTQNQHLGYTGIDYNLPKKYDVPHNTPTFTISLFSEATLQPIELPDDGKDYVCIECIMYREYNI